MDATELKWNQYKLNIDVYKGYLDLAIKLNGLYYAATAAIVTFVLANRAEQLFHWLLIFPIVVGILLSSFFLLGADALRVTRNETFKLRDELGFKATHDVGFAAVLLILSVVLLILVMAGLFFLFRRL